VKFVFESILAIGCLFAGCTTTVFGAAAPPDVAVTYAFVPKDQLSDAVKGEREALAIEAAWRKQPFAALPLRV